MNFLSSYHFLLAHPRNKYQKEKVLLRLETQAYAPPALTLGLGWCQYMTGRDQNSSIRHPTIEPPTTANRTKVQPRIGLP